MNKLILRKFWRNHPNKDLVPYITFYNRVKNGLNLENAMSTHRVSMIKVKENAKTYYESKSYFRFYKNHHNPDNITYVTFMNHIKEGYSLEEAMYRKSRYLKPGTLVAFYKSHPNNKVIDLNTFYKRINRGATKEEAMEINEKNTRKDIYLKTNNPFGISYTTFVNRVNKGMTPEEAMKKKSSRSLEENKLLKFYRSHPNMKYVKYNTFKTRVNRYGKTMEEAMQIKIVKRAKKSSKPDYVFWKNYKGDKVNYSTFKYRVRINKMSWEDAISKEPKESSELRKYWNSIKDPNKVKFLTFKKRVGNGMSWEKAISQPLSKEKSELREYWDSIEDSNKVKFDTFKHRVNKMKMPKEEAIVKPVKENTELRKYWDNIKDPDKVGFETFKYRVEKKKMSWFEAAIIPPNKKNIESDYEYWKKNRTGKGKPSLQTFLYRRINMGLSLEESVYPEKLKDKRRE